MKVKRLPRSLKILLAGLLYGGTIFVLYALLVHIKPSYDSVDLAITVGAVSAIAYTIGALSWRKP